MDFEDSMSDIDPFVDETSTFEDKLTAILNEDSLTDSDIEFLERTQLELEERLTDLETKMSRVNSVGELTIDRTLLPSYKNVNILVTRISDKLSEVAESKPEIHNLNKDHFEFSKTEKLIPYEDKTGFYVIHRKKTESPTNFTEKEPKKRISREQMLSRFANRRYLRPEPPKAYQLIKNVTDKPETFSRKFWNSTFEFPEFLLSHYYLLWAKDKKIGAVKKAYQMILKNIVKTEAPLVKFSKDYTPLEFMMVYPPANNTEKLELIKYLRNKLIIGEINYCYCLYLRNQKALLVTQHAPNLDDLMPEERELVYKQVLEIKDKADALNTPIWEEKEFCKDIRERITDHKWKSNSKRKDVAKSRDDLIKNFVDECEKNYEILKLKVDLYRINSESKEYKILELQEELKELKTYFKRELSNYKRNMQLYIESKLKVPS